MRLIDADYLIKNINENDKLPWNLDKISQVAFKSCVNAMPTAYDVDKVVAELENASHWEDGYRNDDSEEAVYLRSAIEIVKRGSATDDVCEYADFIPPTGDVYYLTSCGRRHNGMLKGSYCPYCGKKIKVVE